MTRALVVMRRELKSYFASPIAYVFGALFLAAQIGFTMLVTWKHGAIASMQVFFQMFLPWSFMVFVSALTMRLWAEERKLGTLELLMTFPVRVGELIAGKFLAVVAYLALVLLLTLGLPLTMSWYGNLDWGPVLSAYLASMLMAGAFVAVGMFYSSLTRDQIIALLLTLVTLLLLLVLGLPPVVEKMTSFLPRWAAEGVAALSPVPYFGSIARGVLDTGDLVYYVCFTLFFLHLNALVLHGRRLKG
ncbi:MAG: ABC transporter permease subunit [Planctomycetota bacterium]